MGRRTNFYRTVVKEAIDRVFAGVLLLALLPFMLLITMAILLTAGRPILFGQTRVGRNGCHFHIYKFRTMKNESATNSTRMGVADGEDLAAARKRYQTTVPNDSRVTPVGRVLRKTHLDELPQLVNVLVGDMSLVGPRPDVPVQEADYRPRYWRERCSVKPGITGLAQVVSARSPRHRTAMDVYYARHVGFLFDMIVLVRTVLSVVRAKSF